VGSPDAQPHVVIVGGYLTEPVQYRRFRRRLLERGAARVSVTPLHLPDWLAMSFAGMGPAMLRTARSIVEARRFAPEPLLVVGHSAGGILARLAMSPEPFEGRSAGVADAVMCLVTLGTPHRLDPRVLPRHAGVRAVQHLARSAPRGPSTSATSYLTVGSTLVAPQGRVSTSLLRQGIGGLMRLLVGTTAGARGDGIVDDVRCRLDDSPHIALPDALHGVLGGRWYGDADAIDRWWPAALERWQAGPEAMARDATAGSATLRDGV
jgi:hypothetical protein